MIESMKQKGVKAVEQTLRSEVLAEAPLEELVQWVGQIEEVAEVTVMKKPELGLVMMRVKESVEEQMFNLGELLITECTVSVDGDLGFSAILGQHEQKGKALAIIDAVLHSPSIKWVDIKIEIEKWLEVKRHQQEFEKKKQFVMMNRTKVNFDVMDE